MGTSTVGFIHGKYNTGRRMGKSFYRGRKTIGKTAACGI
jgi:hypothetical protein